MKGKNQKKTFQELIKRFLEPIKENKRTYIKGGFNPLLRTIIPNITVLLIQIFIKGIEINNFEITKIVILTYIGLFFFRFISGRIMRDRRFTGQFFKLQKTLQKYTYQKYYKLDNTKIETLGTGKIINIIDKGTSFRSVGLILIEKRAITIVINIAFTCYFIRTNISYIFVLFFLVFFFLSTYTIIKLNKKMISIRKERREEEAIASKQQVKMIMSKMETVQNENTNKELKKLWKILNNAEIINNKLNKRTWLMFNLGIMIMRGFMIASMIFIYYYYPLGNISFASISIIFLVLSRINNIIFSATEFLKKFTDDFSHIQKLRDTFDNIEEYDFTKGKRFKHKKGDINIKNISFSYGENKVFESFNLDIKGGTKTAFVGQSGGGKSTLIKIISAYVRPNSGNIKIDGQYLFSDKESEHKISLQSYYKNIGYLTQDPGVFDGTILENLIYGIENKNGEKVVYEQEKENIDSIIKLSKCDFIYDFENGIHTEIGERGVRLSGGQKQRLAIAKVMLKNPNIIFLDEPTSALDSFNEELINEALDNLFRGRTILIVAHRLQTVKSADTILYIDKGKVIESGNHESLIKTNLKYKKMLDLQSGF